MNTILGLIVIYTLIHSAIVVAKKVQGLTTYETVLLIMGAIFVVLELIAVVTSCQ